jgi:hypothetical protein
MLSMGSIQGMQFVSDLIGVSAPFEFLPIGRVPDDAFTVYDCCARLTMREHDMHSTPHTKTPAFRFPKSPHNFNVNLRFQSKAEAHHRVASVSFNVAIARDTDTTPSVQCYS